MSLEKIELVGLACLMRLFVLPVFLAPVIAVQLLRSYRLSRIAKKYALNFKTKHLSDFSFSDREDHMERNVMEGMVNGRKVRMYDSFDINHDFLSFFAAGKNSSRIYRRKTIIEIDGQREILQSRLLLPFASVLRIKRRLSRV